MMVNEHEGYPISNEVLVKALLRMFPEKPGNSQYPLYNKYMKMIKKTILRG